MPKFCPYCGTAVKESDKFCIACGKPLLSNLKKEGKQKAKEQMHKDVIEEKKRKKGPKESEEEKEEDEEEEQKEGDKKEKDKDKKEEEKKDKKEKKKKEIKPLPEDVKKQINLYIENTDIQMNKKALGEKLKEVQKQLKSPEYELDYEFKNDVNVRLEAIKTLVKDLKEKEEEIQSQMDDVFIVQKLNNEIEAKEYQLKNLTKEYRLKRIDKDTFKRLKERYKSEREDLLEEREDLREGINKWVQELKIRKTDLIGEKKLYKGRYSSKEISEEEFKKKDKDYELKLKKLENKIDILEKLAE
ncbi:MAG: hypothetical protein BAJALOKI2v1_390029 [Promethearchaeota archaeon]|nr:MAG: hypothetical protein BAJALOKI2v1_390029 [Candidatus Lokiarchaeota archaeon]